MQLHSHSLTLCLSGTKRDDFYILYSTSLVLSNELAEHSVAVILYHGFWNSLRLPSPQRVVVYRILPALTSEFVNLDMVPFVLPNVLLIAEECTKEEYVRLILPDLTPVFKQQEPVQVDTRKHKNRHMTCAYRMHMSETESIIAMVV